MTRTQWMLATAVVLSAEAAACADPSPLAQVPASAALVIHFNGPDALEKHVGEFLQAAVPEQAAAAKTGLEGMFSGSMVGGGRKIIGLARDGHVFMVFLEAKSNDPTPAMAVLLPVAKYADFREGFVTPEERKSSKVENGYEAFTMAPGNTPTYLVDRKSYAVIASKKETAEAFAKGQPGLDGKLTKDQADRFLRSDFGLYVDGESFKKEYADPIKDSHKQIGDSLDQLEKTAPAQKEHWEILRNAADLLFDAIDDGQSVLLGLELRSTGAAGHAEIVMKPDGKATTALKEWKTSAFRDLARTPAGQMWYTGLQAAPVLAKVLGHLEFGAVLDADSDRAKAAGEALDQLAEAKPSATLQSLTVPPGGVEIWEYEDAQKAVAAETKLLQSLRPGDFFLYGPLKDKPEVKEKVLRYRNMDLTYAHLGFDVERMLADVPEPARRPMIAGLKKLMGDGVSVWFGSDGHTYIRATGKEWVGAKRLLDQYYASDGAVGKDESFAAVRKELPAEASAMVLIDAVQFGGFLMDYFRPVAEALGGPAAGMKLPTIKGKPAFVGAAYTVRPERLDGDLFVSADAVKQLYKPLAPWFPFN
jgi:hypothetical protein